MRRAAMFEITHELQKTTIKFETEMVSKYILTNIVECLHYYSLRARPCFGHGYEYNTSFLQPY